MSAASWALQQAIFAALTADATLATLAGNPPRVFDEVPRDALFPFVVIGDDLESNWDTATDSGSQHLLTVHVWSRAGGRKETKLIADAVRAALDNAALTVSGQTLIDIRYQASEFRRESDGQTWHGLIRFRAVLEPIS